MAKHIHRRNIRFKNEIGRLNKKQILGVAIDTAKISHRVIIFNFQGKFTVRPFSINTLKEGYLELKRQIDIASRKINAVGVYVALETPAKYTQNLVDHLMADYKEVMFVSPLEVAQNRNQTTFRGLKSDDIDAGSVGDLLIRGEFNKACSEKLVYVRLRNLIYWREQKLIMRAMIKNQINHRFERVFPGLNNDHGKNRRLFTKQYQSFLHRGLLRLGKLPQEILSIPDNVLIDKFEYSDHPKGPHHIKRLKSRIEELLLPGEGATRVELDMLARDVDILDFFDSRITELDEEIVRTGAQTSARFLFGQINGVSDLFACSYVGLIGDISKFKSARQIYSYAGLVPKKRQSGNMDLESLGIRRIGNSLLRCMLFRMATQVILCDPFFNDYYKRIKAEKGKSWKECVIIICRKLNNILFALMRDQAPYKNRDAENSS